MVSRLDLTIHSDESGSFDGSLRWEPYVLAAVVHSSDVFPPDEARALWDTLELGIPNEFHANACTLEEKRDVLTPAAKKLTSELQKCRGVGMVAVHYLHRAGRTLPREDVYVDMAMHLAIRATSWFVRRAIRDLSWSGLVPLTIELNLARRFPLNLRPFEHAIKAQLARALVQTNVARTPGKKYSDDGRYLSFVDQGVYANRLNVHAAVVPADQTAYLAMSDLLSNAVYREVGGSSAGWVGSVSTEVTPPELPSLLDASTWEAITGEVVARAEIEAAPLTIHERLLNLLAGATPPFDEELLTSDGLTPATLAAEGRARLMRVLMDDAEDALEVRRDSPGAEARVRLGQSLLRNPKWAKGLDENDKLRVSLDADSVLLAIANHAGQDTPRWYDDARAGRRSATLLGDMAHQDPVALLHNRAAVSRLNRFAFAEAIELCDRHLGLLDAARDRMQAAFGADPPPSWSYGALLGTRAQAKALHGYARSDAEMLDQSNAGFQLAMPQFTAPEDLKRQWVYRGHLMLDMARIADVLELPGDWDDVLDVVGNQLEEDRQAWLVDPAGGDAWRQAYGVHILLKEAWLTEQVPSWAGLAAQQLRKVITPDGLYHPLQQLAGLLAQMLDLPATDPVVQAVHRTAAAQEDNLIGLIARVYGLDLAAHGRGPVPESVLRAFDAAIPSWLRPMWTELGMARGLREAHEQGGDYTRILPFYYF